MSLNSRKVCRCYPWNTEYLTESSRLSSWLRFLNVSGRSAQTLVLISLIICPAQFMLPHYNLNMTHPTQCHYSTPTPPYLIYLVRTIERIVPCHRECSDPSSRAFSVVGLWPLACWDCGFESRLGHGCFFSCKCCVSSGRGLCVGLITSPEESY